MIQELTIEEFEKLLEYKAEDVTYIKYDLKYDDECQDIKEPQD